jgi:hypothetical protein
VTRLTVFVRAFRNGSAQRCALQLAIVIAFGLLSISCTDTGSGYNLQGANASSQDVVIAIGTSSGGSFLLKAKTWGTISTGVSKPTGDIVVSDLACNERTRLPWTQANSTLQIASDGSVEIAVGRQTFPPDVRPVDHIDGGPLSSIGPC